MNKKILKLALPSILANITVPLVGMVDIAIAGRLGSAAAISAIAVGSMFFDILYWNMGFLRAGTGGLTAQAYGRRDLREAIRYFVQGAGTAILVALIIIAIQTPFLNVAFLLVDASPEVEQFAKTYFYVRVWAAPATLLLYVFKGWFIGMQNTVSPMILDIVVNLVNLGASAYFAIVAGMGIYGIALGTVVAQYTGLILAITLMSLYYRKLFKYINIKESLKLKDLKRFFSMNGDLFIRSICFLGIYTGFTSLASGFGDTLLAVSTIMMKLMLLYSYFIDGFAYAGEALAGRYVGAKDLRSLKLAVKWLFVWCIIIAVVSTFVYGFADEALFRLMTDNQEVVDAARRFFPWLMLMPVMSCIAFTWDGIFIGATASKAIRNAMIVSVISFFCLYYLTVDKYGPQALWFAFAAHLIARSIYLTVTAKKEVYGKIESGE